jgi:hypothetical protein
MSRLSVPSTDALAGRCLLAAGDDEARQLRTGRGVALDSLTEVSMGCEPPVVIDAGGSVVCIARISGGVVCPRRVLLEEGDESTQN